LWRAGTCSIHGRWPRSYSNSGRPAGFLLLFSFGKTGATSGLIEPFVHGTSYGAVRAFAQAGHYGKLGRPIRPDGGGLFSVGWASIERMPIGTGAARRVLRRKSTPRGRCWIEKKKKTRDWKEEKKKRLGGKAHDLRLRNDADLFFRTRRNWGAPAHRQTRRGGPGKKGSWIC